LGKRARALVSVQTPAATGIARLSLLRVQFLVFQQGLSTHLCRVQGIPGASGSPFFLRLLRCVSQEVAYEFTTDSGAEFGLDPPHARVLPLGGLRLPWTRPMAATPPDTAPHILSRVPATPPPKPDINATESDAISDSSRLCTTRKTLSEQLSPSAYCLCRSSTRRRSSSWSTSFKCAMVDVT